MSQTVAFAYARARLQAHHGRRPPPETWQYLARVGDFGRYVQTARNTPLRPWVLHVGPHSDAHQIELALRERFRGHVGAVATWQPRRWRPAVAWVRRAIDLPGLQHLLEARPAPGWMARDPVFVPAVEAPADERRAALRASPILGRLAAAWEAGRSLPQAWRARWHELWPAATAGERAGLAAVEARLAAAYGRLERAAEAGGAAETPETLEPDLVRLFRHHPQEPATAFVHLALVWLDMARLRAALLRRRLLPWAA